MALARFVMATIAAAAFMLATTAILMPRIANALPTYAVRTGLPCGQCHVDPAGGGPRTAFGRAFANNGHHLPGNKKRAVSPGSHRPGNDTYDRRGYSGRGGYGMGPGMMDGYDR